MKRPPVEALSEFVGHLARALWRFVREVSGDDAYERYREHLQLAHPGEPPLVRSEYYRLRVEQKWNRAVRCC